MVMKRQLIRKRNVWSAYNLGSSSSRKPNFKREGGAQVKPFTSIKVEPPKAKDDVFTGSKVKPNIQP